MRAHFAAPPADRPDLWARYRSAGIAFTCLQMNARTEEIYFSTPMLR